MPVVLTTALFLISFTSRVQQNSLLTKSFWGACFGLLVWQVLLVLRARSSAGPVLMLAPPRAQHYVQAMCQLSIYVYWGWYWRPVYDHAWLLVAQLLFAYILDMLLSWTRRGSYLLGFGPLPIIFSTNLFLWFKDEWFYLQFALVAVGVLGKEFVRWNREGRYVHIFNPSAFTLGLFSVVLLMTGTTDLTWGQEIASTLSLAPHIYLFLFLVGLVVLYFFSVTLVTASAAATLMGLSAVYASLEWCPVFPGFRDSLSCLPGFASPGDRPLNITAHSSRPAYVRFVVRNRRVRPLFSAWIARAADLLRQTDVRASSEPECAVDRSCRAVAR